MPVPDQPVNAGVEREPYYGEGKQVEEQVAGAPMPEPQEPVAPEAPAMQPPAPAPNPAAGLTSPIMSNVPWGEQGPQYRRPVSVEENLGAALVAMPGISSIGRRLGLALQGYQVPLATSPGPQRQLPAQAPPAQEATAEEA